jgi:hypothetical protein
MKQPLPLSLFLFLLPCLALAQYPSNGNQKITLGEQSTADGLIYRGLAADTTRKPSIDTMAYIILDTATNIQWHYKKATSNAWLRVGGSITSGLTGVLPVANGGTGATTFTEGSVVFAGASGTYTQDNAGLFFNSTNNRLGIGTASPVNPLDVVSSGGSVAITTNGHIITKQNLDVTSSGGRFTGESSRGKVAEILMEQTVTGADGGYIKLSTSSAGTVLPTPKMTILADGKVGVGTESPSKALHVVGDGLFTGNVAINTTSSVGNYALDVRGATNKRFGVQNSNSLSGASLYFYNDSNGFADGYYDALKMYVQTQTGNETIFASTTDNGAYNLQVNGTGVWGAGDYVNGSDFNIKNNIEELDSSLALINTLKPVTFKYNESYNKDENYQLGFIAQDVYQNFENKKYVNSIVKSDGEILSMSYSALIPILTKAIQEQQALIKALEQRIINLENK